MLVHDLVINKILQTKDMSIITTNNFGKEFFTGREAEYLFLMHHYKTYGVVPDRAVFINSFPDFELTDVGEPDSYLIAQLYDSYNTNYLASSFNSVRELIMTGKTDAALQQFKNSYEGLKQGVAMSPVDITADTSRFDRYVERTTNKTDFYISTGFPEIDKFTGGIDRKNENFVVAGRTGCGKSQTILKMAAEASKQGLRVGIYEGEMSIDKVAYRLDTFLGNISNTAINRGELFIRQEYEKFISTLSARDLGPIFVLTPNDVNGKVTVDTLRAFIEQNNLDILFVDQYSLLEDTSRAKTSFERVGNIAKDIKQLQVKYQIPIIAVSQMNRTKNEDGSQDTTQIGLSDMIPQYATVLVMLDRDKDDRSKFIMNIVKGRDGGDGNQITYNVDWDKGKFTYIPDETDGVATEEDYENMENYYSSGCSTDFSPYDI